MKSTKIIAAIACSFCGSVVASDVSVYGMVDAYVQLYNGGNGTVVDLGSGGKGGSRVGIKGTEDLGGGTSVFFRLENGFFVDNGTNTTAAQPEAKRNPRFAFDKMGIPDGAELVFVRNNNIKATVGENNKVKYNDKILSLSALTKKLTGYIVRPVQYWTYDDRNLLNIYNATYPSKG